MPAAANGEAASRCGFSMPAMISAAFVLFWIVIAVVGPLIAPYSQDDFVSQEMFASPATTHLAGTDYLGRDVLSRVIYGARTTLGIGLAATAISHLVGISLGFLAGLRGDIVDTVLSRLNDTLLSIPHMMAGLVIIAAFGSTIPVLIIATGLMYASAVFRIARSLAMDLSVTDFVEVARARGEGTFWILYREILPNTALPLLTDFGIRLSFVILFISSLSFLGLGVQPPMADWGSMVRENIGSLTSGSSLALITPAAAIASLTVPLNVMVDEVAARAGGVSLQGRE